ncbi:MAG: hypothetical protein K0U47_10700 [Epsilonproteobacteria bacterium]|nr:hypothetical protein [Campylobacterota bacterium]
MISIKYIIGLFLFVDMTLLLFAFNQGEHWVVSSQSAFFASLLVTLASYLGYKNMVTKKLEAGDIPKEDREFIDEIEDKHDLYGEEKDLKEVIKEERAKIVGVKKSTHNLVKSASGALSLFRLAAYGVLFLSFLYLNRHGMLNVTAYLVGLAIVPLTATIAIVFKRE